MMRKKIKQIYSELREFLPWLVAAITVLSANLASNVLWEPCDIWTVWKLGHISILRIGHIFFFSFMVLMLYRQRRAFFRPRTRYLENKSPEPKKHLILFVSDLDMLRYNYTNGIPDGLILSDDLDKDIDAMVAFKKANPPGWRWEMPLRSLKHQQFPTQGIFNQIFSLASELSVNLCKKDTSKNKNKP